MQPECSETEEVQSAWGRVAHWLAVNAPASAQALGGPATDEDIAGLRAALGFEVPDVLEALLRMNNGSTAKDTTRSLPNGRVVPVRQRDAAIFPYGKILLGSTEIAEEYGKWRRTEEENGLNGCWSASWVPVIQDFEGQYYGYAVDASGTSGFPALEYGEGSVPAEAFPSLAALLDSFADALESGSWGGWPARVERGSLRWGEE
ncbi:SMI1/KNR4 family protein [Streptomyces griseorubiginosus]|uniref:SMI1/KNR4 family protein n=1 Tax=Streptomyces griseorubiginosus TaxID=67304 RepID=UPI0036607595